MQSNVTTCKYTKNKRRIQFKLNTIVHIYGTLTIKLKQKNSKLLRPQRSLGQGNVFTPVCDSVHKGGVSAPLHAGIHTPQAEHATPSPRYYGIRSTSGRYTSYWSAYLFVLCSGLMNIVFGSYDSI